MFEEYSSIPSRVLYAILGLFCIASLIGARFDWLPSFYSSDWPISLILLALGIAFLARAFVRVSSPWATRFEMAIAAIGALAALYFLVRQLAWVASSRP